MNWREQLLTLADYAIYYGCRRNRPAGANTREQTMSASNWTDAGAITTTDNETEAAALAMSAFVGQFTGRARMVAAAAGAVVYNRTVRPLTYDAAKTGTAANVAKLVAAPTISATDRAAILAYIA